MSDRRFVVLVLLGLAQLIPLLPIGLLDPMRLSSTGWFQKSHAIAVVLGCGFAQASVAAVWMTLGPFPILVRAPCSAASVLLAAILLAINIAIHAPSAGEGIVLGAGFLGVWCCVQAPLWIARVVYRLRLEAWAESNPFPIVGENQFGIRQLLIVTAAVATALGFGRLMVFGFGADDERMTHRWGPEAEMFVVVGLFILCNSLVAFTVATGPILQRHWLFAVALGCCVATAITLVEWNLFIRLVSGPDRAEALAIIVGMNAIQFGWLLINLLAVRFAGYRLVTVQGA